jgi:hypothetical protein
MVALVSSNTLRTLAKWAWCRRYDALLIKLSADDRQQKSKRTDTSEPLSRRAEFLSGRCARWAWPYLAVYLLTVQNWNEAEIGIVMSISAIAGILTETPSGALIDAIHAENLSERLADRGGGHVGDEEADGLRLRSRNGNKKSNTPIRLTPRGLIG